jgi:hypothetical protein
VQIKEDGMLRLPEAALQDYGFRVGDRLFAIKGSRTSGGFGLTKPALLSRALPLQPLAEFIIDRNRCIQLQAENLPRLGINLPVQLLAVRGSGVALGFVAKGPIYEEAQKHPELEVFAFEAER